MLRILIIRDGRPGHYNQSEGVARAIERLTPISIAYLDVESRPVISWHALYFLYNRRIFSDQFFLRLLYPRAAFVEKPDIIISAGGQTLLLNVILSRVAECENIFSGSLRNLDPRFFSAVLINYSRFADETPYIYTLKPSPVDPDRFAETNESFEFCFLIGGPSGTHAYSQAEWDALFRLIAASGSESKIVVLTSRRTPRNVVAALKALSSANIRVLDYAEVGAGVSFGFYQKSKAILVTEDSNSMITEAVCSKKPVLSLAPQRARMNSDETEYLLNLKEKKWMDVICLSENIDIYSVYKKIDLLQPMTHNHLDVLAKKLQDCMIIFEKTKLSYLGT